MSIFRKFWTKHKPSDEKSDELGVRIPTRATSMRNQRGSVASTSSGTDHSSMNTTTSERFSKAFLHFRPRKQSACTSEGSPVLMDKRTSSTVSLAAFKNTFWPSSAPNEAPITHPLVATKSLPFVDTPASKLLQLPDRLPTVAASPNPPPRTTDFIHDSPCSSPSPPLSPTSDVLPDSPVPNQETPPTPPIEAPAEKAEEPVVEEEPEMSVLLDAVEERLKKLNYGAITVSSTQNGFATTYSVSLLGQGHTPRQPKLAHPSFSGMYADEIVGMQRIDELDVEVSPHFSGSIPGTVSVDGVGWERWEIADRVNPRRQTVYFSMLPLPNVPGTDILQRLNALTTEFRRNNPQEEAKVLRQYIGGALTGINDTENPWDAQIADLIRVLNREDTFEDFALVSSIYLLAMAAPPDGIGPRAFLYQIVLGYELLLRLELSKASLFPGVTQQVNANLIISKRWMNNVISQLDGPALKTLSRVHYSQIEGLLKFGELMKWPLMAEAKEYAEGAYERHMSGRQVDTHFIDWMFGTVLPGRWWAYKAMTALLYASPSLRPIGTTPYFDAGLILPDASYWRTRTVMGRVLGGLDGVQDVLGWVGPCPPVDCDLLRGWIRIDVEPAHEMNGFLFETDGSTQEHDLGLRPGESQRNLFRDLSDMTKWVAPSAPSPSTDVCALKDTKLTPVPLKIREDESSRRFAAHITFTLNDTQVDFHLKHEPIFVSTHPCVNGDHYVHERQLERYQNVVELRDLKALLPITDGRPITINAGGPQGETFARAWCAERGKNAVIRRGKDTCYTCAVVHTVDINMDVLIWS